MLYYALQKHGVYIRTRSSVTAETNISVGKWLQRRLYRELWF